MGDFISALASDWLDELQANGDRLTAPRRAVVEVMASSTYVLNPHEVYEQARKQYPRLGLVTVYRTVERLERLGLLQRVHQPSGCQGFVAAFQGHQHLLICQDCNRVQVFEGELEQMEELLLEVEGRSGYRVYEHWLQLFGICSECSSSANQLKLPI